MPHAWAMAAVLLLLLTCSPVTSLAYRQSKASGYAAVCSVMKEELDVLEWVEWHKFIGFDHIFLWEPTGGRSMAPEIQPFIDSGFVELFNFTAHRSQQQAHVYVRCLELAFSRFMWVAFIDGDEFFQLNDPSVKGNIKNLLKEYSAYGGLMVNWVMFGSSGHKTRPRGGILPNYIKCYWHVPVPNHHTKPIAYVERTTFRFRNPHMFTYRRGYYAVDELRRPVRGPFTPSVTRTRIQLNHYTIRSREDFKRKTRMGSAMGTKKDQLYWANTERAAIHNCTGALKPAEVCCPLTRRKYNLTESL